MFHSKNLKKLTKKKTNLDLQVEQLNKIFKLCGTPSEEYWKKTRLPTTFRPPYAYKPCIREAFRHFPSSSSGLLYTLLALYPSHRGSAASALQNEAILQTQIKNLQFLNL